MSRKSKAMEFAGEAYDITVTGRNIHVSEAMKNYAIEKISKIDRFHNHIIDVNVIMDIQKLDHRVDIILKVNNIKIKGSANTTDMYASIDKAVDVICTQIRRYKSRIQDYHHNAQGTKVVDMNVNVINRPVNELEEFNDEIEAENQRDIEKKYSAHTITKKKTSQLHMLTIGEAILRMDLSGDAFLAFRSVEDNKLKVIYRRHDENYGIIELEA